MRLSNVGVSFAWKKQNKLLFSFQKWQHTSAEDNTNAHHVEKKVGCKEEGHQLKVFIKKNSIRN